MILLAAVISIAAFGLWKVFQFVYSEFASPLCRLRGPKATSWIYGNRLEIWDLEHSVIHEKWVKQYGNIMKFKGFFLMNHLLTMDTKAINHVLTHSKDYQKPAQLRYALSQFFGNGLIVAEGNQHRQQRHVMNPAFGPAQIRGLTEIFHAKAIQLRDLLSLEIAKSPNAENTTAIRLDIMPWLSEVAFDMIGLAGFNYDFGALNIDGKQSELHHAFSIITNGRGINIIIPLLQACFPPFRLIPSAYAREIQSARRIIARIGRELLLDAKAAARASATEKGEIKKSNLQGRDLLSLLVKANMATDIPDGQALSDEGVLAQIPTFLLAGHETTSTATTWALFAMTKEPGVQTKLREELLAVDTETPPMDELMALPYLDMVVRETLRVHSPVSSTLRIAMKDDVIPVDKPYKDKYGVVHDSISVAKGDSIFIPILDINRSKELWGPDAREFKPERWENIPDTVSNIPGVWSHLLSFLGGSRACIGYRFSLVEMKALLFTLVRSFEFELAVPVSEIGISPVIVQRPVLRSDPNNIQLPLLVKPYKQV